MEGWRKGSGNHEDKEAEGECVEGGGESRRGMKIEGANFAEREASAEAIRELMADDGKRGAYMILMQDGDEEAFVQVAFDDHPDGIDLEYREGAGTPIFHCTRPVSRAEAERALLEYFAGGQGWKCRFPWETLKSWEEEDAEETEFVAICGAFFAAALTLVLIALMCLRAEWTRDALGIGLMAAMVVFSAVTAGWAVARARMRKKRADGDGRTGEGGRQDAQDGEGGTEAARQNGDGGGKREP